MMRQRAELRIPIEDIASYYKPDHVPYEAKVYGLPWEGGSQRDPDLKGIIVQWSWGDDEPSATEGL